jgi:hypothetical protein
LRLKPKAPATGYVDGAWWPRSRDLGAELPALAEVLAVRLGHIERATFGLSTWDATPRRLLVDGYRLHLEGFHYQDQNVVQVTGSNGGRVSLLVVPPETNESVAHDALLTAGHRDNADRPEEILAGAGIPAQRATTEKTNEGKTT